MHLNTDEDQFWGGEHLQCVSLNTLHQQHHSLSTFPMDLRCLPSILLLQLTIVVTLMVPSVCLNAVTPDTQQGAFRGACSRVTAGDISSWVCTFRCSPSCINVETNQPINKLAWIFHKIPTEEKFCLQGGFGNNGKEETHCACFLNSADPSAPCNTTVFHSVSTTRSFSERPPTSAPISNPTEFVTKTDTSSAAEKDRCHCGQYTRVAGVLAALLVLLLVALVTNLVLLCRQRQRDHETVRERAQTNGQINTTEHTGPDSMETTSPQQTFINTLTDEGTHVPSVYEVMEVRSENRQRDHETVRERAQTNGQINTTEHTGPDHMETTAWQQTYVNTPTDESTHVPSVYEVMEVHSENRHRDRQTVRQQAQTEGHIDPPVHTGADGMETSSSQHTYINTPTDKGTHALSVYETNVTTDHPYEQFDAHPDYSSGNNLSLAYEPLQVDL